MNGSQQYSGFITITPYLTPQLIEEGLCCRMVVIACVVCYRAVEFVASLVDPIIDDQAIKVIPYFRRLSSRMLTTVEGIHECRTLIVSFHSSDSFSDIILTSSPRIFPDYSLMNLSKLRNGKMRKSKC